MANLLDWFGAVGAQVNPFDNGDNYDTFLKRRNKEAAQQAAPPPRFNNQGPQRNAWQPGPNEPPQNGLPQHNFLSDTIQNIGRFNQNNLATANEFINSGKDGRNFAENVGDMVVGNSARLANTAYSGFLRPTGRLIAGENPYKVQTDTNKELYSNKGGLLDAGTFYANSKSTVENPLDFAKRFTGAGVGVATEVAPVLRGTSLLTKPGLSTGQKVLRGSLEGSLYGGSGAVGQELVNNKPLDPLEIAKGAAMGAALGGGIPALGYAKPAAKATAKAANNTRPSVMASKDPRVAGYDDHINQLQQAFDNEPNVLVRHQINKAITAARTEQAATLSKVKREMNEGGYVKAPGSGGKKSLDASKQFDATSRESVPPRVDNTQPSEIVSSKGSIPPQAITQPVPTIPKLKTIITANEPAPQLPATKPPTTLAVQDGGGELMRNGEVGTPIPRKETRYASQTIPKSEFVGEKVSSQTKQNAPTYTPETERGRYAQTLKSADHQGFDNFENDVHQRLSEKHIDSQTVADAQAVAQRLEFKGDDASLRKAADIYDKVSEHLTRSGQTVQAAAIMSRRTPRGMKYQALNDLRKNGVAITPELQRKIAVKTDAIAKTQPETVPRKKAIGELAKEVEKHIPNGLGSNLVSTWKAGLLSGVKTSQGNILSNATFGALKKASDPVTAVADEAMRFFTGKRSTSLTQRGTLSGTKEGIQHGIYTMKTGVDIRNVKDKYDNFKGINFKNKTVQKYVGTLAQSVFNFMSAQDQPFYFSQLKNSLYDLALVDGANKKLTGQALKDHVENLVQNPTEKLMQRATDEASKAVLSYDTVASKFIQGGKNMIDKLDISDAGKQTAHAVVDVLAPFVRVPTAFLSRSIDFTPIGISKELLSQVSRKTFDQRSLSKAIGEGITGTGVIALGAALTGTGQITGDYPSDAKEQQRWKAQGIQPNSIKLGGTYYSLNYLGPIGMLFGAGKKFADASKDGADALGSTSAAIAGFGQTLLGQSFLQGLSGFIDAAKDPTRYAENYFKSQAGSVAPGLVNDFANLTDGYQRNVNNVAEGVLNRIPGLRETLAPKQDVYGNKLKQNPWQTSTAVKPTNEIGGSAVKEVARLHDVDPNNSDLQVTPVEVKQTLTVGKSQVKLDDKQRYDLQEKIGQATQKAWSSLIQTDGYKKLSDVDKANALNKTRTDITALEQRDYVSKNNLGTYDKKLTKSQAALAQNGDVAKYANLSDASSSISDKLATSSKDVLSKYDSLDTAGRTKWFSTQNDAQYQYNKAKYENDKANGSISKVEDIARRRSLKRDEIGSKYSKDSRELYSLNKQDIYDYVSKDKNGKKIADELLKYDRALYDAGVTKYLKFKAGIAPATKKGGKGGSKSKGVSAGSSLISLTRKLNKMPAPKSGATPAKSTAKPQMKKSTLAKYSTKDAKAKYGNLKISTKAARI
jgi:hypothetical protein